MHRDSLSRVAALARSCVGLVERQLGRAGLANSPRGRVMIERLRRLAEALELIDR